MSLTDESQGRVASAARPSRAGLVVAAPWLFVVLWSTGFIAARYATDDSGPLIFLATRFALAAAVLGGVGLATGMARPTRNQVKVVAVAGLGLHALYLGGVFLAISWGMPSGVGALIAGLHPVITAVAARGLLGERLRPIQWFGVVLGLAGVIAVVVDRLVAGAHGMSFGAIVAAVLGVAGISAGTLVQRRHGGSTPLVWGTCAQYVASAAVLVVAAAVHSSLGGHEGLRFTHSTVFTLTWSVFVMSIAAILIMLWLLKRQAAARVSSLFFLTPALSTVEGAILFHERLGALALLGLVVALCGVALTLRPAR
jgi:drug/metabolite transporter (DMT)-like permease